MSKVEPHKFFSAPPESKAALFFLEAHYQLNYVEGAVEKTKLLSPAQIGRAFATENFDSGWFGANVLRFSQEKRLNKILSYLPAAHRKIFVTNPHLNGENQNADTILELEVPLPTLLLLGCGQKYFLWATLDEAISEKSKICHAPFPNLDSSGGICFGANTAPESRFDTIETVWRLILDSPFNNHQTANRCRTHTTDARLLLASLDGKKKFPLTTLIKTEHTVSELWQAARFHQ